MDMPQTDWTLLQSFAAVAEHASLSAAARALGTSQPTLSRHIAALEATLGTRLFERGRSGVTLTVDGSDVLIHAQRMADAAAQVNGGLGQAPSDLAGTVRVTASQVVATFVLPEVLQTLRQAYPQIDIEVVASDTTENVLRREADIALRMYRPTQADVITRHVMDVPLGLFAARRYVEARGLPHKLEDLRDHDVIGYDRSPLIIDGLRRAGLEVDRTFFAFRSDDQVLCWQLVRAGCGIGFGQKHVGDADPDVVQVFGPDPVGRLPLWLTAHPDVRRTPRIRRIYDGLARHLGQHIKKADRNGPPE